MFQVCRIINDTYKFDLPTKPISNIEAKKVVEFLESQYGAFFSDSLNCKRPNVYKNTLVAHIAQYIESNFCDANELITKLEKFNLYCHLQYESGNLNFFKYNGDDNDKIKNIKSRKNTKGNPNYLYLGMFPRGEFLDKMKRCQAEISNMKTGITTCETGTSSLELEKPKETNISQPESKMEYDVKTRLKVWKSRTHSNYSKCWNRNCINLVYKDDFKILQVQDKSLLISCPSCLDLALL
jgi:hypothetical protein